MERTIVKKGYHMEVKSWENDGDFNKTHTHQVDDIEKAKAWKRMCDVLFQSDHGRGLGIANEYGESIDSFIDNINEFFDNDPYLKNITGDEERIEYVEEVSYSVLGYSEEGYSTRVSDRCEIFYAKEDLKVEVIN